MKKFSKKRAFTLVELIVVIAILAILAAIALPKYAESREKAEITAHNANVRILESAANTYLANEGAPSTGSVSWNAENDYVKTWPKPYKDQAYTVTIGSDGSITVSPAAITE